MSFARIDPAAFHRRLIQAAAFCCLALLLPPLVGCMHAQSPAVKPLRTTILIMDFSVPPFYADDATRVVSGGWWFTGYKKLYNPNAGEQFADVLTTEMRAQTGEWVNLFDRLRLRQYFAKKRALLAHSFPNLSAAEVDKLIAQTPPESFARDLGADKVLVGTINTDYIKVNNFTRFWSSAVSLNASLIDVDSGKVLWQYHQKDTDALASEMSIMEKIAHDMVERMKTEYFFASAANR